MGGMIQEGRFPVTVSRIINDLKELGVEPGATLLVHSFLSSIGWVCGGAPAVILALEQVLTDSGTLIMPTYSGDNSDPADWKYPSVPESWFKIIRENWPAYDPSLTPTRFMGAIPECFRSQKGVLRSLHPRASFAAWGKKSQSIIENHSLNFPFGDESPVARAYDNNAYVLFVGTTYNVMASWYYADFLNKKLKSETTSDVECCYAAINETGQRKWVKYYDYTRKHDDFERIGSEFEKTGDVATGLIGESETKLFSIIKAIDFARHWMVDNR